MFVKKCYVMSIQYTAPEFEPMTFGTRVPPSPLDQVNFVSRSLYCKQIIAQSVYFTVLILLIQKMPNREYFD